MLTTRKIKAGILGAGGFTGFELIKILANHKFVSLQVLNSPTYNRQFVYDVISQYDKKYSIKNKKFNNNSIFNKKIKNLFKNLKFTNYSIDEIKKMNLDVIFLAMPNGEAMKISPRLKCKVIDLSADYRFKDKKVFENVYIINHTDKTSKSVFGLPELFKKQIKNAKLIGNPGCYVTACLLASLPIQEFADYIVFDCKSGYSGAGRDSEYMKNPDLMKDNIIPYKLTKHRHKYEMQQFLKPKISFTPHVLDTFRGLLCTAHIFLGDSFNKKFSLNTKNNYYLKNIKNLSKNKLIIKKNKKIINNTLLKNKNIEINNEKELLAARIKETYKNYYKNQNFIKIIDGIPDLHTVQNTNDCVIGGFEIDENNQLVVVSTIDNLLKGASGQAVQNMNIMFSFNETEGLK